MNLKKYIVINKKIIAKGIVTLQLSLEDGSIPKYRPGQYIKVYFSEFSPFKGKEYSISSSPQEMSLAITVRAVGRFSNRLFAMQIGEFFLATLPTGLFNLESYSSDMVMIAGGMGITPFRGIIYDLMKSSPQYKVVLLESVKIANDLVFKEELDFLATINQNFQISRFITQEKSYIKDIHQRRIKIEDISKLAKRDLKDLNFMICGSTSFNINYRKELVNKGVSRENIYSETLF